MTRRLPRFFDVILMTLALVGCGSKPNAVAGPHNPMLDSADQVMWTARLKLTDGGVNRAEVHADTAFFFDENTRVEMRVVNTVFFTETGAKNAVLTSKEGTYNSHTGSMQARGDAYVVAVDKRTLRSPVLNYDQVKNLMSSDSAFTATDSTGRRLDGIGFTSDPNMDNLHCFKNCHGLGGQIILPESGHPAASGDTTGHAPPAPPPASQSAPAAPPSSVIQTPSTPGIPPPPPSSPASPAQNPAPKDTASRPKTGATP